MWGSYCLGLARAARGALTALVITCALVAVLAVGIGVAIQSVTQ